MSNWRDIQEQATAFVHEWKDTKEERSWAQAYWYAFFQIFGIKARSLGLYEKLVKKLNGDTGRIDFFAPGKFLVEHKSQGENLDSAFLQASEYMMGLHEDERPRYIIVCDFARFRIFDLETQSEHEKEVEFTLEELSDVSNLRRFSFLMDEDVREYVPEEDISVRAVRAISELYHALHSSNYPREELAPLLTQLVFCFFADDVGIFNPNTLRRYLEENSSEDGTGIGEHVRSIFEILDTPTADRQKGMHETLAALPYVNGGLFKQQHKTIFSSRAVREMLLKCMGFNWARISPAIFGSMFQFVMDADESEKNKRHDLGAHYTSEGNILKVIEGLFLDDLKVELEKADGNHAHLESLWKKISAITLLDPACGCGNFLVVGYRELRRIELEIIKRFYSGGKLPKGVDVRNLSRLSIESVYGIEIDAFPAEVAKLSLWLMDHMMNKELGSYFGKDLRKLPLTDQPHIALGNALTMDWEAIVPKKKLSYVLGNPPFVSKQDRKEPQKEDMKTIFGDLKGSGELDYVTAWYVKAAKYMEGTDITAAFVSTNSITQGEQAGILWPELFRLGVEIHFAHRTFDWSNEAPGNAAVFCIIIGFGLFEPKERRLYEYIDPDAEPQLVKAKQINAYLVDADNVVILARRKPLSDVPRAVFGSMPNDAGQFLFEKVEEKDVFLKYEPSAEKFIRPFLSAKEYFQGKQKYCLWLKDASPAELRAMPEVMRRVENVRVHRETSSRAATRELAKTPYLFGEDRQPDTRYVLIPRVSSERRFYVPFGFFAPDYIAGDTCIVIPDASLYHLGVLESAMHMAWMRVVCGRLKSDYRYSNELVYNNFPWPEKPTAAQRKTVEDATQAVLDAREKFPDSALSDLYDPDTMPKELLEAHHTLDRAVDACYGKRSFKTEPERLEFLFGMYKKHVENEKQE